MRQRRLLLVGLALAVASVLVGFYRVSQMQPDGPPDQSRRQLDGLVVAPDDTSHPYDRLADFGRPWSVDTDHNHCDARQDALRRDLEQVAPPGGCRVDSGVLHDPYTGLQVAYTRTPASQVQVDHIVPLAYAWRHGAATWDHARRASFASDPGELLATTARANDAKGDRGPSTWMPQSAFRCRYAQRFAAVLRTWSLSVTRADYDALATTLAACADRSPSQPTTGAR